MRVVLANKLRDWFDEALGEDDPKPSSDICEGLGREIHTILDGPSGDELIEEERTKRRQNVSTAGKALLKALDHLEEFEGDVPLSNDLSISNVRSILFQIGACAPHAEVQETKMGRPQASWHSTARGVGRLIEQTMTEIGYTGRLKIADPESVSAFVTAKVISMIFDTEVTAGALATAMRGRVRTKFEKRWPDVARIKIIP